MWSETTTTTHPVQPTRQQVWWDTFKIFQAQMRKDQIYGKCDEVLAEFDKRFYPEDEESE